MTVWYAVRLLCLAISTVSALVYPGYRLPDTLLPSHYILDIIADIEPPTQQFSGKVWIKVECVKPTTKIILHLRNLTVDEEGVTVKEMVNEREVTKLTVIGQRSVPENDFYVVTVEEGLKAGRFYLVHIPFEGHLDRGLSGFYLSKYRDIQDNVTRWIALTQFEAIDARKAFPCFDEPAMKARFTIKLGHRNHVKAISNMPLVKSYPIEGRKGWSWSQFDDSVPMSTYLVAWLVGELQESKAEARPNNVTFRVWARKEAVAQVHFAKDVGPRVLEFFEGYFGIKYPLPKQDMVAVPDFKSGAMENWGLITYRETSLLFDKEVSSLVDQYNIARVIAHELAHQWFGNLVTMKWWSDLWLNEGFATYVATLGVNQIFPEWGPLDSVKMDELQQVYTLDSLRSSHPVSAKIGNPAQIGQRFDTISYRKGATLLRMMNAFLGNRTFQRGVSNYLKEHRYGNAEQDDLWEALTREAHKEGTLPGGLAVKDVMDTWTLQTGFPVVTVIRNYSAASARVTQERYLRTEPTKKELEDDTCWWVPLTYTTQEDPSFEEAKPQLWLNCAENRSVEIHLLPGPGQWVIFNLAVSGLYRVQYDMENWKMISETLNGDDFESIGTLNRAAILLDSLDLAWQGKLDYSVPLSILKYLKKEREYIPWKATISNLNRIDNILKRTANYIYFKRFLKEILTPAYERSGKFRSQPKSFTDARLHSNIVAWACRYEVGDCRHQVATLFDQWRARADPDTDNPVPSNMKSIVYCYSVLSGGEEAWDFLWQRYKASNHGNEKITILSALGCSNQIWILQRYLDWSLEPTSGIRAQDSSTVFSAVVRQDMGFYVGKDFLMRRLRDLIKFHGPTSNRVGYYFANTADSIAQPDEKDQWAKFIQDNKDMLNYTSQAAQQSMETAEANAMWTRTHYVGITRHLAEAL